MAIKLKKIKDRVKTALTQRKEARDCDQFLFAYMLWQDLVHLEREGGDPKCNPDKMTATQLLRLLSQNKMTNFESVRRSRVLLQNEFEELRGEKWEERRSHQENIREEVRTFNATKEDVGCVHIWIPIIDEHHSHHCRLCKKNKKR